MWQKWELLAGQISGKPNKFGERAWKTEEIRKKKAKRKREMKKTKNKKKRKRKNKAGKKN